MTSYDLAVKNGTLVTSEGIIEANILVNDGKIAEISKDTFAVKARSVINASGMLVLPGLIDSHVHFREPGMTQKEDFESGSKGAVAGGVTTVFDMPTTLPIVATSSLLREKIAIVKAQSLVDFGLYGAAGITNTQEIGTLAKDGAIAFKTYTVSPPMERAKEYEGTFVSDAGALLEIMEHVSKTGLLHCVHAEHDSSIQYLTRKLVSQGRRDPMAHFDSRPNFTEAQAIFDAITLAEYTGTKVHILHMSTAEGVKIVREAKARGVQVTSETCPHYLLFSKEILNKFGPYAKFNPPPRSEEDNSALWEGIFDGTVDVIASDHAPHSKSEKETGRTDIWKAPPGTPGVETRLPILLTEAFKRGFGVEEIARIASTSIARVYGLNRRKGAIKKGLDADLTILDSKEEWTIRAEELQTKAKETVLIDGMKVKGRVKFTLVRGEVAFEQGVGFGKLGLGEFVPGVGARAETSL